MEKEELLVKRAKTQIGLAKTEIKKGNYDAACAMLDNAQKQVSNIYCSPKEKLWDAVFSRKKISISIPENLYVEIYQKAKELNISVSTVITLILEGNLEL